MSTAARNYELGADGRFAIDELPFPGVYETVLERYSAEGKLTGDITTLEITDATPAAAASHINQRACHAAPAFSFPRGRGRVSPSCGGRSPRAGSRSYPRRSG